MACVARLEDLDEPVDMVDVFRRSEDVGAIADKDAFFLFAPVKIAGTRGGYGRAIALVGD
jgi:hypothetical protein